LGHKKGDVDITGEFVTGFKGLTGPWTTIIALIILAILGAIFFGILSQYHLITAFAFFVGGVLLLWLMQLITKGHGESFLVAHSSYIFVPIGLGILGYALEYTNIYRVPISMTFKTLALFGDMTITLDTLLLMIIAVCFVVQIILTMKEGR
jgi:hypothetical protein